MFKRLLLAVAFVLAAFTGYAFGQKDAQPLPGGPVLSGGDLGFQVDAPLGDATQPGRRAVTGKFVVKVNGRWVEARPSLGLVPAR